MVSCCDGPDQTQVSMLLPSLDPQAPAPTPAPPKTLSLPAPNPISSASFTETTPPVGDVNVSGTPLALSTRRAADGSNRSEDRENGSGGGGAETQGGGGGGNWKGAAAGNLRGGALRDKDFPQLISVVFLGFVLLGVQRPSPTLAAVRAALVAVAVWLGLSLYQRLERSRSSAQASLAHEALQVRS